MSWIATSIGGSAALGLGGSLFGGIMGKDAGEDQAAAIRYSADKAAGTALEMNNRARADLQPFREIGVNAGNTLWSLLNGSSGKNMGDYLKKSDLFNWQQQEGTRSLDRSLAARGQYGSGAGMEALARFNNQLVADEGQRMFDRLFGVTQLGANAASNMAAGTNQAGSVMANAQLNGGVAAAGADYNGQMNLVNGVQGALGAVSGAVSDFGQYQMTKPLFERLSTGGGGSYRQTGPPSQDRMDNFNLFNFSNFNN